MAFYNGVSKRAKTKTNHHHAECLKYLRSLKLDSKLIGDEKLFMDELGQFIGNDAALKDILLHADQEDGDYAYCVDAFLKHKNIPLPAQDIPYKGLSYYNLLGGSSTFTTSKYAYFDGRIVRHG